MTLIATVTDPEVIAKILSHLGLPIRAPPVPPPWRHPEHQRRAFDDAADPPSLFQ